jgi:predicted NUDIX family NTP pyrophosphohydrolase
MPRLSAGLLMYRIKDGVLQAAIKSNTFTMEWPPKSGRQMEFPEIDQAEFFGLATARKKIKAGQEALIEELAAIVKSE